ncbi:hypothetical protein GPX89_17090 [Nocardia sp. ET3-3]|uniref:Uncharacterized protein n=1 Tax=Nocardia terrae TaxID=2675851 RepID=A0A7K1UXA4_9NOCA|nr:hypothetical protein [Nocardia terrae]MVU78955.1 hypothetical protein [Nocardia terrae]
MTDRIPIQNDVNSLRWQVSVVETFENLMEFSIVTSTRRRRCEVVSTQTGQAIALLQGEGVYVGPKFDVKIGRCNRKSAYSADGEYLGHIISKKARRGSLAYIREFNQEGLGVLIGRRVDVGAKLANTPGSMLLETIQFVNWMLPFRIRFESADSPGFEVFKKPGPSTDLHFKVYDHRVSRMLMISCYELIVAEEGGDGY